MKPLAIILIILVLLAVGGVVYLYATSTLTVTLVPVVATDPLDQTEAFDQIRAAVEKETFIGTRYSSETLDDPGNYLFYTWTVHLENKSFLPVETVEIRITPMTGDVLLLGDTDGQGVAHEHNLAPRESMDLSATVLTSRGMHPVREAEITWYVWGLPFSTRVTLSK